ncbi:MAG: thermonuclease family protein [Rhodospirillales bacterium]|nr:thermonuclease family protein [Rhodospirillales bacterium]
MTTFHRLKRFWFPLFFLIVISMVIAVPQVHADAIISGPPCVIDGSNVQIGGKVRDGKCWGGIDLRLYGSKAPQRNKICQDSRGQDWPCGQMAASTLSNLIRQSEITCYHIDGEFFDRIPLVTCISGRVDLAMEMVLQGLAQVTDKNKTRYILQENAAKKARRGIWK